MLITREFVKDSMSSPQRRKEKFEELSLRPLRLCGESLAFRDFDSSRPHGKAVTSSSLGPRFEHRHRRQLLAFEEFEEGAAAGGGGGNSIGTFVLGDCRGRAP